MALDVSAITGYVDQTRSELIVKQQLENKTAQLVTILPGVKGPTKLHKLATDAAFQVNGCGFNASGTTTLSDRTITPGDIKVNEAICPKDLLPTYQVHQLKAGTRAEKESIPFEKAYTDLKAATIAAQIETALWQGDTASGNANLNKFDGFIKIIDASYAAVNVNAATGVGTVSLTNTDATVTGVGTTFGTTVLAGDKIRIAGVTYTVLSITNATSLELTTNSAVTVATQAYQVVDADSVFFGTPVTAISTSNALAIAMEMNAKVPYALKGKPEAPVIVSGMDFFDTLASQITTANLFHYTSDGSYEMFVPGTNTKLIALPGLNGTNRLYAGQMSNFFYGVDMLNEGEKFDMWYSKDNDQIRFVAEFKAATQVGVPEEIAQFKLLA